jgi:hypothetical protein
MYPAASSLSTIPTVFVPFTMTWLASYDRSERAPGKDAPPRCPRSPRSEDSPSDVLPTPDARGIGDMVASKKATIQNNLLRLWRHTPSPRFEMNEGVCVGMIHLALCNGSCDGPSPSSAPRASALPPPTIISDVTAVLMLLPCYY